MPLSLEYYTSFFIYIMNSKLSCFYKCVLNQYNAYDKIGKQISDFLKGWNQRRFKKSGNCCVDSKMVYEAALDDVVSVLTCLHFACQKEQFPDWAKDSLAELNSILYSEKIFSILDLEQSSGGRCF